MFPGKYGQVTIRFFIHDSYIKQMKNIFNIILIFGFFSVAVYLIFVDSIEVPSPYGSYASIYSAPVTYLIAMLPLSFSVSILLLIIDREKYKKHCNIIMTAGFSGFILGLVVVAPLMKAMQS